MQTFEYLTDRFEIHAIAARQTANSVQDIRLPVHRLWCSEDLLYLLPHRLKGLGSLLLDQIIGVNQMLIGLRKQLRGFHIVHTADTVYYYSYQAAKIKEELGFKLLTTQWENLPFMREWNPLQCKVKRSVLEATDHFAAVSERVRETLILEGVDPKRISVLPPGIDVERFVPRKKEAALLRDLKAEHKDLIISYVGKLNNLKGVEFLLYAFIKLKSDPALNDLDGQVKLAFFGTGHKEKKLKALVERFGLWQDVTFYGSYPYDQIQNVYNTTDIFVLPSIPFFLWQEQLGMVLLESMASGCAVVSTLSGAIPEVIGEAGLLCQPGDFLDLYRKLRTLCLSRELRKELGEKARERVLTHYNAQRNAEAFAEIYENL